MNALTKTRERSSQAAGAITFLLVLGIMSSALYIASDVAGSLRYPGYSYVDQAFSELLALGSPVRSFMIPLSVMYNLLVLVAGVGLWTVAGGKRSLRITSAMVLIYGVSSLAGPFVPMHVRGGEGSLTDVLHIVDTFAMVLSILVAMGFGAASFGKVFRAYSIATMLALVGFGAWTGTYAAEMGSGDFTPWMGVLERMNIYPLMLWIAVLCFTVLRRMAAKPSMPSAPKKVAVLLGSPHKGGSTYDAARMFLDRLEAYGDVRGEIVMLGDHEIGMCRGCKICFDRGEERCPLKDDRDALLRAMDEADAVVFASPNYSWMVSGLMKVFLDRIAFAFHRPRFHGKTATSIVVQGMFRGNKIRDYLEFVATGFGFNTVKGSVIRTLLPMSETALRRMDETLTAHASRFHKRLLASAYPAPSALKLVMFRMSRTGIRTKAPAGSRDRSYYQERGWFESDYYYPTHLGPLKRAMGALSDWIAEHTRAFDVAE